MFLAEHVALGVYRAIKRISKNHKAYKQLMKEVHILKSLKHPNIPIIYDIEEDEIYSYIIEEYLEGESLKAYRLRLSHMEESSVLDFTFQICDFIQYLHSFHSGILYLDLKPDNILINNGKLKLLDFGASVYMDEYKEESFHFGTNGYMAPEQVENHADCRSDIYSIGCLLYFLVTGTIFQPSYISKKWTWIFIRNRRFYKLIEQCLRNVPSERFQSVDELRRSLEKVQKKGELIKKNAVMSYHVAIAGSENRIGVTHIALAITSYITAINQMCIYVEWNKSECVKSLVTYSPYIEERGGYAYLKHTRMQVKEKWIQNNQKESFHFVIKDYGELSEENMQEFLMEECQIIVLGSKPWEWQASWQCLKQLCDLKDILFLFNFSSEMKEKYMVKDVLPKLYLTVPYLSNLFLSYVNPENRKFMDSVIKYVVSENKSGGENTKSLLEKSFLGTSM